MDASIPQETVATVAPPANAGVSELIVNVLLSPAQAVQWIAQRRRTMLLALLLLVLSQSALWTMYYHGVNFEWLREHLLESALRRHPQVDPAQLRTGMAQLTPLSLTVSSIVGSLVAIMLLSPLRAAAYHLTAKFTSERELPFASWLALVLWSMLPQVLGVLGSLVYFALGDLSHVAPGQLSLSSLNALWLHLPSGHAWANWADALDLLQIWSIAIAAAGFQQLAGLSRSRAWLWAATPHLLFFGAWALLNLR